MTRSGQAFILRASGPSKGNIIGHAARFTEVVLADRVAPDVMHDHVHYLPVRSFEPVALAAAWKAEGKPTPRACFSAVDPLIQAAAETAELLKAPGFKASAVRSIKDKWLFREKLEAAGFPQPEYCKVDFGGDVKIPFPVVMKPREGAYGLGVSLVHNAEQLWHYWKRCEHELERGKWASYLNIAERGWLAESLLKGVEVSVEILGGATPRTLEVHEKMVKCFDGQHFSEDRFVTAPWNLSQKEINEASSTSEAMCAALGFTHGVGNLEGCMTSEGFRAIELQLCPAGGLLPAMVRKSSGIDLLELHVRSYLEEPIPRPLPSGQKCAMQVLHAPHPGVWKLEGIEECNATDGVLTSVILESESVVSVPHADYVGFVVTTANNSSEAVVHLERATSKLNWRLLRPLS